MSFLEQQILKLTKLWMQIVGLDHHKDRDCHWIIQESWSYGDPPRYYAWHHGYIYKDWYGPYRQTRQEALLDLYNELIKAFKSEYKWAFDKTYPEEYNEYPRPEVRSTYKEFKSIINESTNRL